MALNTTSQTTNATHTHPLAKPLTIEPCVASPTTKLHAAYMPTGKTVDQRRTS